MMIYITIDAVASDVELITYLHHQRVHKKTRRDNKFIPAKGKFIIDSTHINNNKIIINISIAGTGDACLGVDSRRAKRNKDKKQKHEIYIILCRITIFQSYVLNLLIYFIFSTNSILVPRAYV